jgi:hypothetical protein
MPFFPCFASPGFDVKLWICFNTKSLNNPSRTYYQVSDFVSCKRVIFNVLCNFSSLFCMTFFLARPTHKLNIYLCWSICYDVLQFIDDKVQQMHINNLRKLYCALLYVLDHLLQEAGILVCHTWMHIWPAECLMHQNIDVFRPMLARGHLNRKLSGWKL